MRASPNYMVERVLRAVFKWHKRRGRHIDSEAVDTCIEEIEKLNPYWIQKLAPITAEKVRKWIQGDVPDSAMPDDQCAHFWRKLLTNITHIKVCHS